MISERTLGVWLVAVQVVCCVLLIAFGWRTVAGGWWLILGVIAGSALSASSVVTMKLRRLKVTPEPHEDAELLRRGPYRFIRHPMYAGLLLAMGMFALGSGWLAGGIPWLGLLAVLLTKIRIEERHWRKRDTAYAEYAKRTKRLVPWVW